MKKTIKIYFTPKFQKQLVRIPVKVIRQFDKRLTLFMMNPYASLLRTHKLSGRLSEYYAFSINQSYRVLFEFLDDKTILLIDVGTHAIYR